MKFNVSKITIQSQWSGKGAAADVAWYMGPTAIVSEILQKLTAIFGTVASFNVLMQNFTRLPREP